MDHFIKQYEKMAQDLVELTDLTLLEMFSVAAMQRSSELMNALWKPWARGDAVDLAVRFDALATMALLKMG